MADGVAAGNNREDPPQRQLDYEFCDEILHVRGVIRWGADLIAAAERLGRWDRADVVDASHSYESSERSNSSVSLYHQDNPELATYEGLCVNAFHACTSAYKAINPWMPATCDTGYQLLRYQPGQQFKAHFDAVPGRRSTGQRQLSGVAFMNENFHGGELLFPRQKRVIRPRTGDVVMFPSHYTHPHASQIITRGVKYSVVCWFV